MGYPHHRALTRAAVRARTGGQTVTEYLMVVGILVAIIISLTKVIVPTFSWVVVTLTNHLAVFISSVRR